MTSPVPKWSGTQVNWRGHIAPALVGNDMLGDVIDGMLDFDMFGGDPVRVDYELTDLGRSLLPVQRAIKDWAEDHVAEVIVARRQHDQGLAAH